ncbi:MAG: type II toxin-antitoxin system RelE/ParE family toxin [Deltaproteobacteria bacterium]|jgi:mRNA interferase RelE/StbE|nr:type II toxin-antitoxin system RelE/ParE family toxin [Deltaproteobacteria bacterium]
MSANEAALVRSKIQELAMNPFAVPNVKSLAGRPGYRLRVGDWRILFEVAQNEQIFFILKIAQRGGAYR